MRKTTALIAAIALLGSLTACAGSNTVDGCSPGLSSGPASTLIKSKGALGTAPAVSIPTPLYAKTSQVSQLIAGKGRPVETGQAVLLQVSTYNARTGRLVQPQDYSANSIVPFTIGNTADAHFISAGLQCAKVGSRIAIIGTAADSHHSQADSNSGLAKNDSLIYVIDVLKSFMAKADGANQIPVNGLPTVVTTANGTPGISIPDGPAPTTTKVEVLKLGSGAVVKKGSVVNVKYTAVDWATIPAERKVFDSTWTTKTSTFLQIGASSVVSGLSSGLEGKRVGSQVLIVLPPKDDVAQSPSQSAPVPPTDTPGVYVVDILGIA